ECIALPGLDGRKLAETLNEYQLPGVKFQPITYKPYYFTFKDKVIGGVQLYFTEPGLAPLTPINFYALEALKKLTGRDLFVRAGKSKMSSPKPDRGASALSAGRAKTKDPYEMFDKVNGTDATRKALQARTPAAQIVASWKGGEAAFREKRKRYLLY